jgi:hypothetical protein
MTSGEESKSRHAFIRASTIILCVFFVVTGILAIIFGGIPWPGLIEALVQFVVALVGVFSVIRLGKFILALFVGLVAVALLLLIVSIIYLAAVAASYIDAASIVFAISILIGILLFVLSLMLYKRAIRRCC